MKGAYELRMTQPPQLHDNYPILEYWEAVSGGDLADGAGENSPSQLFCLSYVQNCCNMSIF